jgi:recombination endonuclease VII
MTGTTCTHCSGPLTGRQRKLCSKKCQDASWRLRNLEQARAADKAYRSARRDLYKEKHRAWREKNPDHIRRKTLIDNYNLTTEQYEEMVAAQDGKCAACGNPETALKPKSDEVKRLAVDHDHGCCPGYKSCGNCIRGLLCARCNVMEGMSTIDSLWGMLLYLERYTNAGSDVPSRMRKHVDGSAEKLVFGGVSAG